MSEFYKIVGLGPLDFDLNLHLSEEIMKEYSLNADKITKISDIEKLLKEKPIQDLITLTSKNFIINTLLFINRTFKEKTFVEYIVLSSLPIFLPGEEFMTDILKTVSEQNFLFMIYQNVIEDLPMNFNFNLNLNGHNKTFTIGKAEKNSNTVTFNEAENLREDEINNQDNSVIFKKIDRNPFFLMNYNFKVCNYIFLDLNDMLKLKPYGMELIFLIDFLMALINDKINITINYPNIINNISLVNIDDLNSISEILTLTDTFIFEKKEASAFFTVLAHINSEDNKTKTEEKSLEVMFLKDIKKKRKSFPKVGLFMDDFNNLGIIEQNSETNLVIFHSDFSFELYPTQKSSITDGYTSRGFESTNGFNKTKSSNRTKQIHSEETLKKSDEIRKIILLNYQSLKSVFFGGFFSRYVHQKSFNTAGQAGMQVVKKTIELIKNKLPFPVDTKFFIAKIKRKKDILGLIKEVEETKSKESRFFLDCCNKTTSSMKNYNPLFDDNLTSFFSAYSTRKHLKKTGFINKKGYILADPDHNNLGKPKNKNLIKVLENEEKKLNVMKNNNENMKFQINRIFDRRDKSLKDVKVSEIEKLAKVSNYNPNINKKLPSLDFTWDKHPLSRKTGSMLYAASVTTTNKNKDKLVPISKEIYINLLNNFENRAINAVRSMNDEIQEKWGEEGDEKSTIDKKNEKKEPKMTDKIKPVEKKEEKILSHGKTKTLSIEKTVKETSDNKLNKQSSNSSENNNKDKKTEKIISNKASNKKITNKMASNSKLSKEISEKNAIVNEPIEDKSIQKNIEINHNDAGENKKTESLTVEPENEIKKESSNKEESIRTERNLE